MISRDIVKLAFQYREPPQVPYYIELTGGQKTALARHYRNPEWQKAHPTYIGSIRGVDNFLSGAGMTKTADGGMRDILGCVWQMGTTHHLTDWPLHEPCLGSFRMPDLKPYFDAFVRPHWPANLTATTDQFRIIAHTFGLFERAWSLRGFEDFLVDLALNEAFVEELLEHLTEWFLQSIDLMAGAPVDAIFLTDDHGGQRGMLMGAEKWRKLFKPRWKRIYERIHHYGIYTIMHMCGDTTDVIPDLIEIGLDCMESCQPECMDIYGLKQKYGRDIRFWGGLGAQQVIPFGTPADVRRETRRLKQEMGAGGGFILAPAKAPGEEVPIENIAAYLDEAAKS